MANEALQIASADATQMAETIFGEGVKIVSASYTGQADQAGIYSGADKTMPGVAPSDTGLILSTGRVASFSRGGADANTSEGTTTNFGGAGDDALSKMVGQQTFDAAVFETVFVPTGDMLSMQIVWSSEEYLEYVNSGFNDAFSVWVNGVPAELVVGRGNITIDDINNKTNSNLYVDNPAASNTYNTEMDGFTVTLTLKVPVVAGKENSFRMAIADAGDGAFDSAVLIAANSVQVALIAQDDDLTIRKGEMGEIDVLRNDMSSWPETLTITKINGVDVLEGDSVKLPSGETITLKGGRLYVQSVNSLEDQVLTYEVTDGMGNTDVAFVRMTMIACFTEGTLIDVPGGRVAVERLVPGDLVLTRDHGAQVLRWVGRTVRAAMGADAPVEIAAGTLGDHGTVRLSGNHRVLVTGARAELLFGEAEVLVKAKHLVDGRAVRVVEGGEVAYLHLLFDRHEVVKANGLDCESYHPATLAGFDAEVQEELLRLFPALRGDAAAYGPLARPEVTAREARLLAG
ncbi:choice-of-anchor L domain-containing protein [Tabrizicola sp. TH137]|uniref:choice-of-anchor L domain-containing protein n=1 Tax=Tabrizicola sp. TH137 TaxID=2067452 RepID=UPI0020B2FF92|nr:choice-of-anchor L domain-containing protein [Tabrizicola sp. TH137]